MDVLQTVAIGCPGGRSGKAEASTTLRFWTPMTLAFESTTALGSLVFPIEQVQAAWKTVFKL